MMVSHEPVRLAVAGIGGYAKSISNLILRAGGQTQPAAKLVAACDPALAMHADRVAELRHQGVHIYPTYEAMLDHPGIDGVWLPIPIQLHLPFAELALKAGRAVMVEKPAAGCIDEVNAMIALRDRYRQPFLVGYQDVYDRTTLPLKRRILAGEFGDIGDVTLYACWPRSAHYFDRAAWAGRVRVGDTWVLDSPANNALAHYVNIVLFLLGATEESAARPTHLEVELYRSAPIENYDTISARVHLEGGRRFLFLLTHACADTVQPITVFHGSRATVTRSVPSITIEAGGATTTIARDQAMIRDMLQRYTRAIRGVSDANVAAATLEVAREHARVLSAASEAAPIEDTRDSHHRVLGADDGTIHAIPDIGTVFARCAASKQMLHESGLLPFTRPASVIDLTHYTTFAGPKMYDARTMSATS